MRACVRQDAVEQSVRAGHWPQGCAGELRDHVAACPLCAEQVRLALAFAAARKGAMRTAVPQSSELLWWKAQLRRRHDAVERVRRPGMTIAFTTFAGSVLLLIAVLTATLRRIGWSHIAVFSLARWSAWVIISLAIVLCGFVAVAIAVGLDLSEKRG